MSLLDTLANDVKLAMKARDTDRLATLRLMRDVLQKLELSKGGALTEADELDALAKAAKQRRESIDAFRGAGREELAAKEEAELAVIEAYLPKQLDPDEVRAMAREVIAAVGASSKKDMGKVMGPLMPKLKGRFPGKDVKPLIESLLGD
jgi:uncharacterized protein YqeY